MRQMTNYIMPTSMDFRRSACTSRSGRTRTGPAGAKGIGELPMDGPAPAIFNAVAHATGLNPVRLPLTPESLMELLCPMRRRGDAGTVRG